MMDGELQPGTNCGPYVIRRLIATGGQGEVYEAVHDFTDQRVALKCMQLRHAGKRDLKERMRMEAVLLCKLRHPNLVTVYNAGITESGIVWIAMDLLEGQTLRQIVSDRAPLPLPVALRYASRIADGVHAAHALGIVHRDLKPENVFVTRADEIKVLDLGTAKFYRSGPRITHETKTPGTPAYMSPEHLGGEEVDGRTDVYALGIIVYEMLAGRHPFARGKHDLPSDRELVGMQLATQPAPLTSVVPGFPDAVWRAVAKALSKRRDDRHTTMAEFGRALVQSLEPDVRVQPTVRDGYGDAMPAVVHAATPVVVSGKIPTPRRGAPPGGGAAPLAEAVLASVDASPYAPTLPVSAKASPRDPEREPRPRAPLPRIPTAPMTEIGASEEALRIQPTRTDPRGARRADDRGPHERQHAGRALDDGGTGTSLSADAAPRVADQRMRLLVIAASGALGMASAALVLLGPWGERRVAAPGSPSVAALEASAASAGLQPAAPVERTAASEPAAPVERTAASEPAAPVERTAASEPAAAAQPADHAAVGRPAPGSRPERAVLSAATSPAASEGEDEPRTQPQRADESSPREDRSARAPGGPGPGAATSSVIGPKSGAKYVLPVFGAQVTGQPTANKEEAR